MHKYTREQLIFYLKKLASQLKKSPRTKDMNSSKDLPSATTYYQRFGSWNNALKAAELSINIRKRYNKAELQDNLRQLAKELGRMPKATDLRNKKWAASYSTYKKYFGGWNSALRSAGLKSGFTDLKKFSKQRNTI